MNTDKTLADVQPGGRVRLGDALLPCPFCGNDAEFVPYKNNGLTLKCKSMGCIQRHQRTLRYGIDWLRTSMTEHWNTRALSSQPSPGGQGDALELLEAYDQAVEELSTERSDGWNEDNRRPQLEADVAELRAELVAALAARQPVGQEPTMPMGHDDCPVTGLPFYDNMEHPERGLIAMYGGPLDVYSVPELRDNDGELRRERYDLDADCWVEGGEPLGYFYREQQPDAAPVGEPVEHDCANCDRRHAEVICPTCAGIAWDNGRLHEFHEVRELSTSLGEGVLDLLLPDEWHEKPLLRFQGAHDEGDDSVGISPRSANVLADDQTGTVLGDYLAARAAKEGGR